jgi:hypothetical protein
MKTNELSCELGQSERREKYPKTAPNSEYMLRPSGVAFGTFGFAGRHIFAERQVKCLSQSI